MDKRRVNCQPFVAVLLALRHNQTMEHGFWHERWQKNEIGFHEAHTHEMLEAHWPDSAYASMDDVLVPLCGKSLDMRWLAQRGHGVIGSELSEIAVRDFFATVGLTPEVTDHDGLQQFASEAYRIWCGDFFQLGATQLSPARLFYDRASLVALPQSMRQDYARHLLSLLAHGARGLLITLQYDDEALKGPPFSVSLEQIDALFGRDCIVDHLEHSAATVKGRFEVQQTATRLVLRR